MPNLHELRVRKGVSQQEVANAIGVKQAMLSHLERSRKRPSMNVAIKLAEYFDVSVDIILDRSPLIANPTPCLN